MTHSLKKRLLGLYIRAPGGKPISALDPITWARWFEDDDRRVAQTEIGPYRVSTVFLGVNLNFLRDGPPVLWETVVFDAKGHNIYLDRYTSEEAALAGHENACQWVRDRIKVPSITQAVSPAMKSHGVPLSYCPRARGKPMA